MANNFSKEERVAFEDILAGFNDALVMSKAVKVYRTEGQLMERARDTIWRPQPNIMRSQNRTIGTPVTAQIGNQLSVPATLGFKKNVTWNLDALELRDALQEGRLGQAAYQRLATDVNVAVMDTAANLGSLVVKISTAAGTYDDVAKCDTIMNEQGVPMDNRHLFLSSRDYNGMANNLAAVTRSFGGNKSDTAYERGLVGQVAGFTTHKLDYANAITAQATSVTIATNGAQVRFVPRATTNSTAGVLNVDNRFQQVTVSTTSGVNAGDAFTIANIQAVHHVTKRTTGQLKTFRVVSVDSGTTMTITPPIIGANSSPTDAELQYQNVYVAGTSATAAITWLNTTAGLVNPFFVQDAIEVLPARYAVPDGQGVDIMRGTTDQGFEVVMGKKFDNSTFNSLYTLDILFGTVMTNTEMAGILLFSQS